MRHAAAPLLLVLLLVPGAWAEPVRGDLTFPEGLVVEGDAGVSAAVGALDLAAAVAAGAPLSLRFAAAHGYAVARATPVYASEGLVEPMAGQTSPDNASVTLGPGTLEGFACGVECRVLLLAEGTGGALSLSGHAAGPVALTEAARVYAVGAADGPAVDSFYHQVPAGHVAASLAPVPHQPTLLLGEGSARATGNLTLFFTDAKAEWRAGEARQGLDATTRTERDVGLGEVSVQRTRHTRFFVLHLSGAELTAPDAAPVTLLAPAPLVRVEGVLRAAVADGTLDVGGRRVDVDRESLEMEGALEADVTGRASGLALLSSPTRAPLDAPLSGEASRVAVGGRPVPLGTGADVAAAGVAVGLSLAGLAALLLLLKSGALTPFYLRVTRGSLLRNPNRLRILQAVHERPGVTVPELVRGTGLSEMAVRHHVRMLEAHHHLAVRGSAKVRGLFALDGATVPQEMALHVMLKDETRRRIASAVAHAPAPRTQGDLAAAAGVSRRLVSYHLARLEKAGLVEPDGATPAGYRATARLAAFLGAASAEATPAGPSTPL